MNYIELWRLLVVTLIVRLRLSIIRIYLGMDESVYEPGDRNGCALETRKTPMTFSLSVLECLSCLYYKKPIVPKPLKITGGTSIDLGWTGMGFGWLVLSLYSCCGWSINVSQS